MHFSGPDYKELFKQNAQIKGGATKATSPKEMKKETEKQMAAARAGIPQVAFPFMADQFENRKQIVKLGLGPNACDFKKISVNALTSAITECIKNDKYEKNAVEISQKQQGSNGLELTLRLIEKEFNK